MFYLFEIIFMDVETCSKKYSEFIMVVISKISEENVTYNEDLIKLKLRKMEFMCFLHSCCMVKILHN